MLAFRNWPCPALRNPLNFPLQNLPNLARQHRPNFTRKNLPPPCTAEPAALKPIQVVDVSASSASSQLKYPHLRLHLRWNPHFQHLLYSRDVPALDRPTSNPRALVVTRLGQADQYKLMNQPPSYVQRIYNSR